MDKDVVYIYNGILLSHKKEGNHAICDNMDRSQGIMLSEINQTERQILYKLSYMWNLDKTKARLIDTENSMVVVRGGG